MRVSGGWMLVGGGLIAVAAACGAAEPGAAAAVDRLVPRLASGSATNRDEAEWALLDLGPAILPPVVAASPQRAPPRRARATRSHCMPLAPWIGRARQLWEHL